MEILYIEVVMKILYTPEHQARQEICSFINEGLKDVQGNTLYDMNTVFDELEIRYVIEKI